jgi:putative transposase
MILTYKVRHGRDFFVELAKARQIAQFAIEHRTLSSKDVKQFGLKSVISNQILRKYSRNWNARKVNRVKLTVPAQGIRFNHEGRTISVPSLKFQISYMFRNDFEKINQIEFDHIFAYISLTVPESATINPDAYLGVDRRLQQNRMEWELSSKISKA